MIATLILAAAAPLPALGTWRVSYEDSMCIASRPFGTTMAPVTLAISKTPLNDAVLMLLMSPPDNGGFKSGVARISVSPPDASVAGNYISAVLADRSARLTRFNVPSAGLLPALHRSGTIRVQRAAMADVALAPSNTGLALQSLDQCARQVAVRWGVPAAALEAVATAPELKVSPASIYSTNDYPVAAVRTGVSGATTMLLTVATTGRVVACKVVGESGSSDLDKASCLPVLERVRFNPALGKDGHPVESYTSMRVNWVLPGGAPAKTK